MNLLKKTLDYMERMKITDVRTHLIDQYMFVQVDTDEGISGVGESGAWAFLEASKEAVETFDRASLAVYVPVLSFPGSCYYGCTVCH